MKRKIQLRFNGKQFKSQYFFGGSYCSTRAHRTARPLSVKYPLHLVLRSSRAIGKKSFWEKGNKILVQHALKKFSDRWGIKILECANVGNHLHLYIKLTNRFTYEKFIRAFTGAIALQLNKWNKNLGTNNDNFWDYRPYTRIVVGLRPHLVMRDYMLINQLEGLGALRFEAKMFLVNSC